MATFFRGTDSSTVSKLFDAEHVLDGPVTDTVYTLQYDPAGAGCLAAASWDGSCTIWGATAEFRPAIARVTPFESPLFDLAWTSDWAQETSVCAAGVAGKGAMIDVTTERVFNELGVRLSERNIGAGRSLPVLHDIDCTCVCLLQRARPPIRCVSWLPRMNSVAMAGWDGILALHDPRASDPSSTGMSARLTDRAHCMDAWDNTIVVGTALPGRTIQLFDVRSLSEPTREFQCPLLLQMTGVACFDGGERGVGLYVTSAEGRCAVRFAEKERDEKSSFSFKCHRKKRDCFPVHAVKACPQASSSFATAGGDGGINFWDWQQRIRLKAQDPSSDGSRVPVTAIAYGPQSLFAYSSGENAAAGPGTPRPRWTPRVRVAQLTDKHVKKA